jgi:hypothetical protein
LFDFTHESDLLANLAHIKRVIVADGFGVRVGYSRVFPRLRKRSVVPNVPVVWEAVSNEAQIALLFVLLDGIEWLFFGDL